jgi:2'-deoxynucleoside 5'-phosphate N-hydrolase
MLQYICQLYDSAMAMAANFKSSLEFSRPGDHSIPRDKITRNILKNPELGIPMNIYFSCSITGGRQDEAVYGELVVALLAGGHTVPTAHLSQANILIAEGQISPEEVFLRDMEWVSRCDAVVAEVSTPSHGVGYEIAAALMLGKPVFCCYQAGRRVSKMITGNPHPALQVFAYRDAAEAVTAMQRFLSGLRQPV